MKIKIKKPKTTSSESGAQIYRYFELSGRSPARYALSSIKLMRGCVGFFLNKIGQNSVYEVVQQLFAKT